MPQSREENDELYGEQTSFYHSKTQEPGGWLGGQMTKYASGHRGKAVPRCQDACFLVLTKPRPAALPP